MTMARLGLTTQWSVSKAVWIPSGMLMAAQFSSFDPGITGIEAAVARGNLPGAPLIAKANALHDSKRVNSSSA